MCCVIDYAHKVQTESSTCLDTSRFVLWLSILLMIFLILSNTFVEKYMLEQKEYGCAVLIHVKNRAGECMHYTTVLHVKSWQNMDFLQSVLHHIKSLCVELYQITDIDSDADVESKME